MFIKWIEAGLVLAYLFGIASLYLSVKSWRNSEIKAVDTPKGDCNKNGDCGPKNSALVELLSELIFPVGVISFIWFVAFIIFR